MTQIRERELIDQMGLNAPLVQKWRRRNMSEGVDYIRGQGFGRPILYTQIGVGKFNKAFSVEVAPRPTNKPIEAVILRSNFLNRKILMVKLLDTGEVVKVRCRNADDYPGRNRLITVRWDNGRYMVPWRENTKRRFYNGKRG